MIELGMIRDLVAIFGVIAGFTYYVITVRNQNQTRQAQLFMQLFRDYTAKDRWKEAWTLTSMEWDDYEDFTRKYDSSVNIENFAMRYKEWYFYEGMARARCSSRAFWNLRDSSVSRSRSFMSHSQCHM